MTRKRKVIVLSVVAAVALAGGAAWYFLRDGSDTQYRAARVDRGDINVTISATGNPNPVVTVQVGSQVSGTILALFVDFNTKVTKGMLIARIDPAPFQARVDQSRAVLEAARASVSTSQAVIRQATLGIQSAGSSLVVARANIVKAKAVAEDARAKMERRVVLVGEGILTKEELETTRTTYSSALAEIEALVAQQRSAEDGVNVAKAQLDAARSGLAGNQAQVRQFTAALQSAQLDLSHTRIMAPVDGVVVSRNIDVGQTVAASLSAPTLFLIAQDMTKMQVDTNVSEADVGRVREGQSATFTVDAYPGQVFTGKVTSVRKAPINVQNVITYDAVIGVSNAELKLFPGMTANVKILVTQRPDVLRVPNAALRYRPTSETPEPTRGAGRGTAAEKAVWVLDEKGKPRRVVVETGVTDGAMTEIAKGELKEGDRVLVGVVTTTAAQPASQGTRTGGRGPGF